MPDSNDDLRDEKHIKKVDWQSSSQPFSETLSDQFQGDPIQQA
ncbi:hypothetical protein Xkoz_01253 [Xenorhabdus kozodoii]|uniref:Uncharacterized protein n=1 Tax=Xenorhabdus kozodoii TaxID=351676 RepID=A0A2D0LEL7_9GAMM|nr:hypothetical protein Xkoz_01253 [Xenorhabdus kozodoii]